MIYGISKDMLEVLDHDIPSNLHGSHVELNKSFGYCEFSRLLLVEKQDCPGCDDKRYAEFITVHVLKKFNVFDKPWLCVPQFKHIDFRSGKGGNDTYKFDFGFLKELPTSMEFLPYWLLEVNEGGHFKKKGKNYTYIIKPSDYLKWVFCIKNRIPLLFLNMPEIKKKVTLTPEQRDLIISDVNKILKRMREYMHNRRILWRKTEFDEYFIKNFCDLPYKKILLDKEEFEDYPHLIEPCLELLSHYKRGQLKEYVREIYFQ